MPTFTQNPPTPAPRNDLAAFRRDPIAFLRQIVREQGDVATFRIGRYTLTLLAHPEHLRELLVTQARRFTKGPGLLRTRPLLGDGLLTSDGDLHKADRKRLMPAFSTTAALGNYSEIMRDSGWETAATWHDGETVSLLPEMTKLTLAIAGRSFFGIELAPDAALIGDAVVTAIHTAYSQLAASAATGDDNGFEAAIRSMADSALSSSAAATCPHAHVARTLASMERSRAHDHAVTLLLAGHESLSNAMTWTYTLLSRHPLVRSKMEAEIDAIPPSDFDEPFELTQRLPYTRAVFAESMRLFPPAWMMSRRASEPVTIAGCDYPAGSLFVAAPCVTHIDSRWFPDPLTYQPERWVNDPAPTRNAYFPFGSGPRLCIGEPFAWAEGILLLATIGRKWRVNVAEDYVPTWEALVTLRPKGPVPATFTRRS